MVGLYLPTTIESFIAILENMNAEECLRTSMAEIFNKNDWKLETCLFQSDIALSKMCRFSMDGSITTALMGTWKLGSFGCNSENTSHQAV